MESELKKARTVDGEDGDGEDRISSLPDELIHHIFSFINAKFAVQSGILSNRWKNVWRTLPHLNFSTGPFSKYELFTKFVGEFLSRRNRGSNVDTVDYHKYGILSPISLKLMIEYAISHNVRNLYIISGSGKNKTIFPISLFESKSLEKLTLDTADIMLSNISGDAWCLPALTELKICESELSFVRFPWSLPALTSLDLKGVKFAKYSVVDFADIVNLKGLSLYNCSFDLETFDISSYKLEHLTICNDKHMYDVNHIHSL